MCSPERPHVMPLFMPLMLRPSGPGFVIGKGGAAGMPAPMPTLGPMLPSDRRRTVCDVGCGDVSGAGAKRLSLLRAGNVLDALDARAPAATGSPLAFAAAACLRYCSSIFIDFSRAAADSTLAA